MGGWRRVALLLALVVAGAAGALAIRSRWQPLGPLRVAPGDGRLSVRVGESLDFSAEAAGASGYAWSIWGRVVSHDRRWRYVPAPEDAGWQQVSVTVTGRGGRRIVRRWDVGVVRNVPPALVDVTPPPGHLALAPDASTTFRCGARVAAARPSDRLRFEWSIDGQKLSQDEHPAAAASSQLDLPAPAPGSHTIVVRVTEDDHTSSFAEWTVDVSAPALPAPSMPVVATATPPPPPPPAAPPLRRVARAPAPDRLDAEVGQRIDFRSGLAPENGYASYEWKIDGEVVQHGGDASLAYRPALPGTHRVDVTVRGPGGAVGVDGWRLEVTRPVVLASAPPTLPSAAPPPARPVPPPSRAAVAERPAKPAKEKIGTAPAERPAKEKLATAAAERAAKEKVGTAAAERPAKEKLAAAARETYSPAAQPEAPPLQQAAAPAPPVEPPALQAGIREQEVQTWLQEYAHAWSRRDVGALQRMGQVRSEGDAARLVRYFGDVQELHVDVRLRSVRIDGDRAAVEFERIDTVTDPTGRRQELRLPIQHKDLRRVPGGLRFVD